MMKIFYGIKGRYTDVSSIAFTQCYKNKILNIPDVDVVRSNLFGDPHFGIVKHIKIEENGKQQFYDQYTKISIKIDDFKKIAENFSSETDKCLQIIHNNLLFSFGSMKDEYPEQVMTILYIKPDDIVLELGANIGRNTLIIATKLNDQQNLVTLECDQNSVNCLTQNRDQNNYNFHIEPSALSYKKLIQCGWDTTQSDVDVEGWVSVPTITFENLQTKYNKKFTTMVVDCEGALYYILKDNPDMIKDMKTIIMENDYYNIEHKIYVDSILKQHRFERVYFSEGGWGSCENFFFEVWQK